MVPTRSHHKLAEEKRSGDWLKDPHNLWRNPSYSSMTECPPSDKREAGNWEQISNKVKRKSLYTTLVIKQTLINQQILLITFMSYMETGERTQYIPSAHYLPFIISLLNYLNLYITLISYQNYMDLNVQAWTLDFGLLVHTVNINACCFSDL